ncbi:MAG: T9SS type A sorting domain-containing protein [Bacteroidetes bacterium]|nr:T9SS type A sorting domain-containing protein [Bacteroidota bacterium]
MADYGGNGMPKIVVIGGGAHTVFYTANDVVDATALQNAIDDAIDVAGISEQNKLASSLSVSPNPSSDQAKLKFNLAGNSNISIQLFNLQGKLVQKVFSGNLSNGENLIEMNTLKIAPGTYLVKLSNGSKSDFINLVVAR